ncbi:MAG TPA: hypothetical protein VIL86_17465 [Tepidisphaeraceae bacterium]|jgi:hypothetical protein
MAANLKTRVAALEQQVARLQQQQTSRVPNGREWIDDLYGKFAGDSVFAEAMRLGRKYRRSLRPRTRKGKSGR